MLQSYEKIPARALGNGGNDMAPHAQPLAVNALLPAAAFMRARVASWDFAPEVKRKPVLPNGLSA